MQLRRAHVWALIVASLIASASQMARAQSAPATEYLFYGAEWRFVRAGEVGLKWTGKTQIDMTLKTVGLVSSIIKVDNEYRALFGEGFCAKTTTLDAQEGKRRRETKVTYDSERKKAIYLERDVVKNAVVLNKEMDIPPCVHDVTGGLQRLRELMPERGKTIELPISDGKKVVAARVDSLGPEKVKTPLGEFQAMKYEAFLFNGVLFRRKGRLFIWITNDERRLPVQIRVQLPFYIGTVTLQLEKMER